MKLKRYFDKIFLVVNNETRHKGAYSTFFVLNLYVVLTVRKNANSPNI